MAKSGPKKRKQVIDFYNSLDDTPVYYWFKVEETNDVSWLLKYRTARISKEKREVLAKAWDDLVCQYIDEFGISENFMEILLIRKYIATLKINEVLYNQNNTTFIEIEELKLKELSESGQKTSNEKIITHMEKYYKLDFDTKKISVKRYFYRLQTMNEEYEELAKQRNKAA